MLTSWCGHPAWRCSAALAAATTATCSAAPRRCRIGRCRCAALAQPGMGLGAGAEAFPEGSWGLSREGRQAWGGPPGWGDHGHRQAPRWIKSTNVPATDRSANILDTQDILGSCSAFPKALPYTGISIFFLPHREGLIGAPAFLAPTYLPSTSHVFTKGGTEDPALQAAGPARAGAAPSRESEG